jgi:hydroxymethylglutaryl-CoA reductase (NADPH)
MEWLESEEGRAYMKRAFDATSNYARVSWMRCHVSGRMLFMRFVATTGDAMGMNMLSKVGALQQLTLWLHWPLELSVYG